MQKTHFMSAFLYVKYLLLKNCLLFKSRAYCFLSLYLNRNHCCDVVFNCKFYVVVVVSHSVYSAVFLICGARVLRYALSDFVRTLSSETISFSSFTARR